MFSQTHSKDRFLTSQFVPTQTKLLLILFKFSSLWTALAFFHDVRCGILSFCIVSLSYLEMSYYWNPINQDQDHLLPGISLNLFLSAHACEARGWLDFAYCQMYRNHFCFVVSVSALRILVKLHKWSKTSTILTGYASNSRRASPCSGYANGTWSSCWKGKLLPGWFLIFSVICWFALVIWILALEQKIKLTKQHYFLLSFLLTSHSF